MSELVNFSSQFVRGNDGAEGEFHVVGSDDTDRPARSGCGNDAVVWLRGSSTVQSVELSHAVGSLQNLDLGLDGTLSDVTGPQDHLGGFDVVGDVEVTDGTAAAFGGSSLYGGLGGGVEDLLGSGPGFFHALGIGNLGTELDGEFVASCGGDFEGLGSGLEL